MSSARRTPPRNRPSGTSPMHLTAQVEEITTTGSAPARQHASTPKPAAAPDTPQWVNFSTYLPAPLRRTLKARCAALDLGVRDAVAQAITAWLAANPQPDEDK